MRTTMLLFMLLLAPFIVRSTPAAAQQIAAPREIDAEHPMAKHATRVLELLLQGDADAAIAGISEVAAPAFRDGALAEQVRELVRDLVATGPYEPGRLVQVPIGVALLLRHKAGGPPFPFSIYMEQDAPHLIARFERPQGTHRVRGGGR